MSQAWPQTLPRWGFKQAGLCHCPQVTKMSGKPILKQTLTGKPDGMMTRMRMRQVMQVMQVMVGMAEMTGTTIEVEFQQDVVGADVAEEVVEEMLDEDEALTSVWD